jgi:hypothetical protein
MGSGAAGMNRGKRRCATMKARMKTLGSVLILFSLLGCAMTGGPASGGNSAIKLEIRQIDGSVLGSESFNTIRVEMNGPNSPQLYGYFLYRDGLTVQVAGPMTGKPLGKMSLKKVQADYQLVIKENRIDGGELVIQEAVHGIAVCGFIANMPGMNYAVRGTTDYAGGTTFLQLTLP